MESSAQGLLAPIPTITAGVSDPLAVDQGVGEDGGLWVRRNLLVLLRTIRRTAVGLGLGWSFSPSLPGRTLGQRR